MKYSFYDNTSAFVQLLITGLIMLTTLIAGSVVLIGAFLIFSDMPFGELLRVMSDINSPQGVGIMRIMQIVQSFILFIIPAFIIAWVFSAQKSAYLSLRKVPLKIILAGGFILLLAGPFINLSASLNESIKLPEFLKSLEDWMRFKEDAAKGIIEKFLMDGRYYMLLYNIFLIAILPAIGEELIFRGVLQNIFVRWTGSIHAGILITGLLFSFIHFQFYGFFPRALLGILFGYLLYWSGSIWVPVFAHFTNNAMSVILYFFIARNQIDMSDAEFGAGQGEWVFAMVSLILAAALGHYTYKKCKGRVLGGV